MKYQKKIQQIDAVPFQWGMEDGIIRYSNYIPKECSQNHPEISSTKYPGYYARYDNELDERGFNQEEGYVPYIATTLGYVHVPENGYITTDCEGNRYPYSAEMLALHFEAVSEAYKFNVNIGDWSQDGHNKYRQILVESTHPIDQVQDAFISAAKRLELLTDSHAPRFIICDEYEDYRIPDDVLKILIKANVSTIDLIADETFINGHQSMVHLLMRIAQIDLPSFGYNIVTNDVPNFNGFWDEKLNVSFGYGLFT